MNSEGEFLILFDQDFPRSSINLKSKIKLEVKIKYRDYLAARIVLFLSPDETAPTVLGTTWWFSVGRFDHNRA